MGGSITPPEAVVTDRGICWSTSSGVTISDHKSSEGGLTGGSFSKDITGLWPSSTIYYRAYFTTASGTTLSDESSFSNVPVFTGVGYWDDAERWNVMEVPANENGEGYANSPIIDGICTMANSKPLFWVCHNLTINDGAKLIIKPSQALAVTGLFTNNADAAGLVIQSDPLLPNATFAFESGSPRATVEMYSKASWDLTKQPGSKYSWQFFGIPVKTLSYSSSFSNCYVQKYDETSTDDAGLWDMQGAGSVLTSGAGYEIVQQSPKKYQFIGELTNSDFERTLNYTTNGIFAGQHIFANPYTMAIDISKIEFGANTEQAVYLYNTGTYNQWNNPGDNLTNTTTAAGQYTVSTPNAIGELGVPTQIPSVQGFLVKARNNLSGSIYISRSGSGYINTDLQRVRRNNVATSDKIVTRIDLAGSRYADCLWIFTDSACTRKFDNGWDGYKMKGSPSNLQLYATEADGDYQIDAVKDINETYLSFQAGQDTVFTLTFTNKNLETRYAGIYLVDLVTNQMVDVSASGSEYQFKAQNTPEPVIRFKIITKPTGINTAEHSGDLKVFSSKDVLIIDNSTSLTGNFELYNISGSVVKNGIFGESGITTIATKDLSEGIYIVKAVVLNKKVTERIVIR